MSRRAGHWIALTSTLCFLVISLAAVLVVRPQVVARDDTTAKVRAEVANAAKPSVDPLVIGKLELPQGNGPLVLRFNADARVEFSADAVVPNSIRALAREELKNLTEYARGLQPKAGEWFSLRLKKGSECTLHYRTLSAKITLDRASQQSFYIDTRAMKVVHLEKKKDAKPRQIDCDNEDDADNMEVIIYTNRACCCSNNSVEAYGYVSCDDDWSNSDCFPRDFKKKR